MTGRKKKRVVRNHFGFALEDGKINRLLDSFLLTNTQNTLKRSARACNACMFSQRFQHLSISIYRNIFYRYIDTPNVQSMTARFVTGNYLYETGSMTGILEQLKWESLKKRRRDSRIIMLYKGLKGAASIPTNDLVPPIRHVRNHHSLAFQTPFANTDIYKCSFFPQTIRDWNSLTDTFLSAAEGAEDSVAKFTSLVRARD